MKLNTLFRFKTPVLVILAAFLGGCATREGVTISEPVGPMSMGSHSAKPLTGYLKVYSATQECNDGDLMYYPHSEYAVYNPNGTRVEWVQNHLAKNDEEPEVAALPAGNYIISAQSERDGMVRVPVVIRGGATTVLHLEQGRASDYQSDGLDPQHEIKSPSGQVIGWRAAS